MPRANQAVRCAAACPTWRGGRYQTVLANILATPLKVLAPLLCARVAPGGRLVLSGILERQADELRAAYAPFVQLRGGGVPGRLDTDDGSHLSRHGHATTIEPP